MQAAQAQAARDSDSEGELFVPKSRKRRRDDEQPGMEDAEDIDAEDTARCGPSSEALASWAAPGAAQSLRDRFVTGLHHALPAMKRRLLILVQTQRQQALGGQGHHAALRCQVTACTRGGQAAAGHFAAVHKWPGSSQKPSL